jgi:protein-tyrosine phosphatase
MCRKLLAEAGSDAPCASAGIRTTQAARPPAEACEAARRAGLSLDAHEPIQLTRELVDNYDVIVVMEAGQMQSLRTAYPDAANRTVLLPLYDGDRSAGYERYNIADPFGQSPAAFDACYDRIQLSLARFLDHAGLCPTGNVEVHARTEEGAAAADDGGDADRKNARASSHRDRR